MADVTDPERDDREPEASTALVIVEVEDGDGHVVAYDDGPLDAEDDEPVPITEGQLETIADAAARVERAAS